jgi:hypothetical protein
MSVRFATLIVALVLAAGTGGKAEAQVIGGGLAGGPRVFTGPGGPVTLTPGYAPATAVDSSGDRGVGPSMGTYIPPYSYYAAIPPMPARIYVGGSGPNDFPFYGRPYGHVYDRWSWQSMSDSNRNVLARYYDPPVK